MICMLLYVDLRWILSGRNAWRGVMARLLACGGWTLVLLCFVGVLFLVVGFCWHSRLSGLGIVSALVF